MSKPSTPSHDPDRTRRRARVEAWAWAAFGVLGMFVRPVRESIPVIFFMSAYANAKGAAAEAQGARAEES